MTMRIGPLLITLALVAAVGVLAPRDAAAKPQICVASEDVLVEWKTQDDDWAVGDEKSCAKACKSWVKGCKKAIGAWKACALKNLSANKQVDIAGCALKPTKEETKACVADRKERYKNRKQGDKSTASARFQGCEDWEATCVTDCTTP
jgi:hypothetical protein